MFVNGTEMEGAAKPGSWLLRRVVLPLFVALLALGFVYVSTGLASSSAPLKPAVISKQTADAAPALGVYNGTVYVGWTGRNAAHNMNLMTYDQASQTFGPAIVLTDATPPGSGPSLAVFNGNLSIAWRGYDNRLNVAFFKPGDPTHLANKVTLSETSYQSPSILAFNGRLYLSWQGGDGRLNIISSADARTFNTKVTYNIPVRTSPTLQQSDGVLFVAWEDTSASSHLVFAQYNPSNPGTLNSVVTTTTGSTLPMALFNAGVAAPDLRVAWTAGNGQIDLGIYQGTPTLTNLVTTSQYSPFGPAMYTPFLSWTGLDALRSVNVMQINF